MSEATGRSTTCSALAYSKVPPDKVPGIMLTLNAMPHEPHGFSASMIATGREPTLPPDVHLDAHPSPSVDNPSEYIEAITQRLQLTHQQMAFPSPPPVANPYQVGSLIYALTTPPERASKLSPRWKGPYRVCRIPNDYQVVYEDGEVERTIHINHAKPAKFTDPDLPGASTASRNIPPSSWISTSRPRQTSSSSSCSGRPCQGLLLLFQRQRQPLPLKTQCRRPLPRQPISGQNPLLVHGDLPGSTLSWVKRVL